MIGRNCYCGQQRCFILAFAFSAFSFRLIAIDRPVYVCRAKHSLGYVSQELEGTHVPSHSPTLLAFSFSAFGFLISTSPVRSG